MRQLTASEASNDEMERQRVWREFQSWWLSPERDELRKSCSTGWALYIWQAALKIKQGEV